MKILEIFKKKETKKETFLSNKGLLINRTIVPPKFLKDTHTPVWDDNLYNNKIYLNEKAS